MNNLLEKNFNLSCLKKFQEYSWKKFQKIDLQILTIAVGKKFLKRDSQQSDATKPPTY